MFRRHTIAVSPTTQNNFNSFKTPSKSKCREWLKVFLSAWIPLMIGVFTIVTTVLQQKLSTQQREQDKQDALLLRQQSERQADNLRKETVFATYLDDVSKLLMMENETQSLLSIRTKTLTSLRQLDAERKQHLLLFLYENELVYRHTEKLISSLLKLNYADFNDVYFKGTIEVRCSFLRLYMPGVYLSNSSFTDCYIDHSTFSNAIMYKARFLNTILLRTSFRSALLNKANFSYSKLNYLDFSEASLIEADFTGVVFRETTGFFINTNLTGAIISPDQLRNITLYNSILPNGTWGPIQTKNLLVNGDVEQNCTSNGNNFPIGWNVSKDGEIKVFAYSSENLTTILGKCYFRATSFNTPRKVTYAFQSVILDNFSLLISAGLARYHASANFQCFGTQSAYIELYFIDLNGLRSSSVYSKPVSDTHMKTAEISNITKSDDRSVRLTITFIEDSKSNLSTEESNCICDNVKFSITKV